MDLSLQPRPVHAARSSPVLRVVETARLLLHEDPDPGRVARLRKALGRDGVLRNPPAAALMPDGRAVVLDGANRVTALRDIGIRYAVVQAVDYGGSAVVLSTWRHYLRDNGAPPLRGLALGLPGARTAPATEAADGEALLERREAAAVVVDAEGTLLVGDSREPISAAAQLRALVGLYQGLFDIHRVDSGDRDRLSAEYGPGSLVAFPVFRKDEILVLAARGGRLPTGVTRHVIPGRALRLNTPLEWLAAPADVARKQAELDATVQQRWLAHGVRHYTEPTFLFDE
jgi:hypothetical protein